MDPRVRAVRSSPPGPLYMMPAAVKREAIVNARKRRSSGQPTVTARARRPRVEHPAAWFRWFDVAHMSYRVRLEYNRKAVSSQHSGKRASGPVS